jgi:hypothetical protein
MTNPAKITAFLTTHKGQSYCDDCLAKKLGLARRQEAQQITATLATTRGFTRVTGSCSICSKVKLVICAT